ncbi:MAG: deoxyguanosinetriphosphate triphosphohydrolase [Thiotrichaceae bacterium]
MKKTYAANAEKSRGRHFKEPAPTYRSEYQRDRDRIIHSTGFRRLEYKTQVFVNHEGDLYRTRLTHSLEVAQIARSVARTMGLDEDLTEAIALAHDLGHTPFGHAGQDALNACNKKHGGFEHNLQSLRVVDWLETSYADFQGLNLTFETREGILKHCNLKHAKALGDVGERFFDKTQPSLEAQLTNIADEIAYNNHDIDDGLRSGLINVEGMRDEVELFAESYDRVMWQYPNLTGRKAIHETIRRIIGLLVVDLTETSQQSIEQSGIKTIEDVRMLAKPLMQFSEPVRKSNLQLKHFLRENLYYHHKVYRMTRKAQLVIEGLYNAFFNDLKLLPPEHQALAKTYQSDKGDTGKALAVIDYIAGMTDRYARAEYKRLYDIN